MAFLAFLAKYLALEPCDLTAQIDALTLLLAYQIGGGPGD